ncbi:MAG: GNAT family N-acetyltransferase [Chloroflexi bacterium]|nr:GNAT family N-acetyltransferase [Chloroflexota bacterium]
MIDVDTVLNNPVWHALNSQQAKFALGSGLARRFPAEIGPFAAVAEASPAAYAELASLIPSGEGIALVGVEPPSSPEWELLRQITLLQMVYEGGEIDADDARTVLTLLTPADVSTMLELVSLTHPGPFEQRTIELGSYLGVWQDGRLAAMAGERFHVPGYHEISAVCTHPDFQRHGYARKLVTALIGKMQREGDVPILHVVGENTSARGLYGSIGFRVRAELPLLVLKHC